MLLHASEAAKAAVVDDAPDDPGPLAKDLSPELKSPAIRYAMEKVAHWQIRIAEPNFNSLWTFATLYDGLIAISATTGNSTYRDAMPDQIANTKANLDRLLTHPDDPNKILWWWCDALYMAPPVLVRMAKITGDHKYIDFMNRQWDITTTRLYNPSESLYFRDERYLNQTEANGKPLFWSRGNGWVIGALVMILQDLPTNDSSRLKFVTKLQDMAAALAAIQGSDGLWRPGLLNPAAYDLPEVSGSAFYTYAMAYGINEHILDRKIYEPVVAKAWAGMLTHIYADGRLGCIQPVGAAPGKFKLSSSSVFGIGGFLLAGSEVDRMAGQ
ncbi:hypothetical protein BGW38_000349 [Lunasporangiospora selenospora]|uniref:Rhamnogalacturonyl hydrolase YesR n=1 Tax=Lunasporangiospora selenospora TaxID=979761 RepID=A0A9P6KEW8_9FUNG|nr:hypothetical protein BGW38_000349 [Lunasporangiospora selenospora]